MTPDSPNLCVICGKPFLAARPKLKKYCSRECHHKRDYQVKKNKKDDHMEELKIHGFLVENENGELEEPNSEPF